MPQIALQGRLQLTPNHQLHLVRSTDELILLCTFPNGASVVSTKAVECVQNPASRASGVDA
jgi:hypothetical protein